MDSSEYIFAESICATPGFKNNLNVKSNILPALTAMKRIGDEKEYSRGSNGLESLKVVPFTGVDEEYNSNEMVLYELTTVISPNLTKNTTIASRCNDLLEVMDTNEKSSPVQKQVEGDVGNHEYLVNDQIRSTVQRRTGSPCPSSDLDQNEKFKTNKMAKYSEDPAQQPETFSCGHNQWTEPYRTMQDQTGSKSLTFGRPRICKATRTAGAVTKGINTSITWQTHKVKESLKEYQPPKSYLDHETIPAELMDETRANDNGQTPHVSKYMILKEFVEQDGKLSKGSWTKVVEEKLNVPKFEGDCLRLLNDPVPNVDEIRRSKIAFVAQIADSCIEQKIGNSSSYKTLGEKILIQYPRLNILAGDCSDDYNKNRRKQTTRVPPMNDLLMAPVIAEVSSIRRRNRENRRIAAGLEVEPRGKPVQVVERIKDRKLENGNRSVEMIVKKCELDALMSDPKADYLDLVNCWRETFEYRTFEMKQLGLACILSTYQLYRNADFIKLEAEIMFESTLAITMYFENVSRFFKALKARLKEADTELEAFKMFNLSFKSSAKDIFYIAN
ncbi:unnamed protein product, partial [Allacma fusca]